MIRVALLTLFTVVVPGSLIILGAYGLYKKVIHPRLSAWWKLQKQLNAASVRYDVVKNKALMTRKYLKANCCGICGREVDKDRDAFDDLSNTWTCNDCLTNLFT